ncbi:MAG: hypothetical protein ACXVFT_07745 [Solirubrobacteraceae bacterium]
MTALRRLPGEYYGRHPYLVSKSLDGLQPGRREVGKIIVRHLGPDAAECLHPLHAFGDLRELELEWAADVDLEPLAALPLEALRIEYGQRLDLEPLARMPALRSLSIIAPRSCTVPAEWPLGPPLTQLFLSVERPAAGLLREAVTAIPWRRLTGLTSLAVMGEATRDRPRLPGRAAPAPDARRP